jgi:Dullard-like phosphatase family protein
MNDEQVCVSLPVSEVNQDNGNPFTRKGICIRSNSLAPNQIKRKILAKSFTKVITKFSFFTPDFTLIKRKVVEDDVVQEEHSSNIRFDFLYHMSKYAEIINANNNAIHQLSKLDEDTIRQLALLNFLPVRKMYFNPPSIPRPLRLTSKTAMFDLDGTLIYTLTSKDCADSKCQHFPIFLGKEKLICAIRPHLQELLAAILPYYDVMIFTSSHKEYADQIISKLDPQGNIFSYCFSRESCFPADMYTVKDLNVIGRDLRSVVLIDNCITCFRNQVNNGIPIKSFGGRSNDQELLNLKEYMLKIKYDSDVRTSNTQYFMLEKMAIMCKDYL